MSHRKFIPLVLFLAVLCIQLYTSCPSIGWWNSGYYAACSYRLSIPDQGGSILYVLLGRIFTILFFLIPAIHAITLVSIVSTALASVFFFYGLNDILQTFKMKATESIHAPVSFLAALALPFLYSVWVESLVSRVYTQGLLLTSVLFLCAVRVWFSENDHQKTRYFLLALYVLGIDFGAHRLNLPFVVILIFLLLTSLRKQVRHFQFWLSIFAVTAASLSLHLYLIVRGQLDPLPDIGNTHSWGQLFSWINMRMEGGPSNLLNLFHRRAPFWSYQVDHMYVRYFAWNFLGTKSAGTLFAHSGISLAPFLLGCAGFVYCLVRNFKAWLLLFTAWIFFSIMLVFYFNVVFGFHNIREIDRLFLPSFFIFLLWVGIGLFFLFEAVSRLFERNGSAKKAALISLSCLCLIILPLNLILSNWHECNKNKYHFPEDFAYNFLSSCEKNAVIFTNGDNDTFPLWYLQGVEGYRTDVTVANISLLNAPFYIHQLAEKGDSFPVDSAITASPGPAPSRLEGPVLIALSAPKPSSGHSTASDSIKIPFNGHDFGGERVLLVQDKVMISFLNQNHWKRPVYFASTVESGNLLGLEDYLTDEGIVRRLVRERNKALKPGTMEANLLQTYRFRYFDNPGVWIDNTTVSLYDIFRHSFAELATYYANNNQKDRAKQIYRFMGKTLPEWRFSDEQNAFLRDLGNRINE